MKRQMSDSETEVVDVPILPKAKKPVSRLASLAQKRKEVDEEEAPKKKGTAKKAAAPPPEEETKPKAKKAVKKEESESEEEAPKAKAKAPPKSKAKVKVESESEEETPKPKKTKAPVAAQSVDIEKIKQELKEELLREQQPKKAAVRKPKPVKKEESDAEEVEAPKGKKTDPVPVLSSKPTLLTGSALLDSIFFSERRK